MVEFADGRQRLSPDVFRDVVDDAGVEVLAFQIEACGAIEQIQNQQWLVAGENRFLLEGGGTAPAGPRLCLSGRLDDRADPDVLTVTAIEPVTD